MDTKIVAKVLFIILHVGFTVFLIKIIDDMVGIDNDYIQLIITIIVANFILYLIFQKVYDFVLKKDN